MLYVARTQRGVLGFYLGITLLPIIINNFSNGIFVRILFILLILLAYLIQFKLKIEDGFITYQILLLTISIYQKKVSPNQIIEMKFKRVGWFKKGAIIQIKKGFNMRVVNFSPDDVLEELIKFANANDILITKNEGYMALEKTK
ncbi:hypothetical protein [Sutcliffiella halmapala]|uniref:hypothetical protein n=1 Tax=Sutcliffiella halmapala TaxID=79882 RepID=UPI000994CE71|nr:hypothetical protein [Sutcliffiella halmapala]